MTAAAEVGLRERKKAATRQALHEAAVRLAIELGTERVTVEAIADDAGVSRRTFSNYFANKEEALLHGDAERMRVLIDMVRARPAGEAPWTALTSATAEFHAQFGDLDPTWVARGRAIRTQPMLLAAQAQTFAAFERELEAEVAARLTEPSPVRARLTAAMFLTAMRVSMHLWLERSPGTRLWDLIEESLAEAGRGLK